ncbi:MAG: fructosamine kinase family protein [Flavobacteriaceae bacterium]|nr:fructosamine kinase family protein [Flavobacteriaceae bacterium]
MEALFEHIGSILKAKSLKASPLAGGDINEVYLLTTSTNSVILKHSRRGLPDLFKKEAQGLWLLKESNSFRIPEVIAEGNFQESGYLLLEYIPEGHPSSTFWDSFALSLSQLHSVQQNWYGLDHSNYIGSLIQYNQRCTTNSEFFITQRLEPQLRMAANNGFLFQGLDQLFKNISEILPKEPASLIHGDLWNGNFLASANQLPVLIDPAVSFASREMDLAMMQLFGGFPDRVFSVYEEAFPLTIDWKSRIPLWQLYYLLVHLNLFGAGYFQHTRQIISQFSS